MKILLKILPFVVVAGIGFGAGSIWIGSSKSNQLRLEQEQAKTDWDEERAHLEQLLAEARNKPAEIQTVYKPMPKSVTNRLSPEQVIQRLIETKLNNEETRNDTFRRVIFLMQSLTEMGPYSLPAIRNFLAQNVDVDYTQYDVTAAGDTMRRARSEAFNSRSPIRTQFLVPPSLRLGLFQVLGQIKGPEAERVLADMLSTTARGVEVAFLARVLQDVQPDTYVDDAVQAAQELLSNPPEIADGNRLDDHSKAYLYRVLVMFNDASFAQTAQSLVVTPHGSIDKHAIDYLKTVMKEHAMPAIAAAYNDPRITNRFSRAKLLNEAVIYAGAHKDADAMFEDMALDKSISPGIRGYTLTTLAGNSKIDPPSDPTVIRARIDFLEGLKSQTTEKQIVQSIERTQGKLEALFGTPNP